MTRKDYKAIAEAIRANMDHKHETIYAAGLVSALEDYMSADNERFDGDKFAEACGFPVTD